jgi:sec-independent protein translocase protein TatC
MIKYILEIKNRLFLLFLTYCSTVFVSYYYKDILLFVIIQPKNILNGKNQLNIFYFIFTDVTEIFSVYIKLVVFLSFQIILLFVLYHLFLFFSPALFKKEYNYVKSTVKTVSFVWFISLLITNYFIIPLSWNFFLSFQELFINNSFNIHFEAKLSEYLNFCVSLYYLCGLYFQFFLLLFFILSYLNTSIQNIKRFRKIYYFGFVLCSTLICLDIFSQIIISLLFILMYEIFLLIFLFNKFKN